MRMLCVSLLHDFPQFSFAHAAFLQKGLELQGALMELYGTLIENAVQFGCSNARMRKVRHVDHAGMKSEQAQSGPRKSLCYST